MAKMGRPIGRKLTEMQRRYLAKRGIDWFFWLCEQDTDEYMVLRHKMNGIKKIVAKDEES